LQVAIFLLKGAPFAKFRFAIIKIGIFYSILAYISNFAERR